MKTYVLKGSDYAPDQAWRPLTPDQRTGLAMLAKRAHVKMGRGENIDEWRHAQSIKAVGRRITEAGQRDFLPLRAHFLDLLGKSDVALNVLLRAESEPQRIALHMLQKACTERGLPLAYPEAICQKQNNCCLAEANAKQIWRLVFTVRNRRPSTTTKKPQR